MSSVWMLLVAIILETVEVAAALTHDSHHASIGLEGFAGQCWLFDTYELLLLVDCCCCCLLLTTVALVERLACILEFFKLVQVCASLVSLVGSLSIKSFIGIIQPLLFLLWLVVVVLLLLFFTLYTR
jgi:hypothetical protein